MGLAISFHPAASDELIEAKTSRSLFRLKPGYADRGRGEYFPVRLDTTSMLYTALSTYPGVKLRLSKFA